MGNEISSCATLYEFGDFKNKVTTDYDWKQGKKSERMKMEIFTKDDNFCKNNIESFKKFCEYNDLNVIVDNVKDIYDDNLNIQYCSYDVSNKL